MSSESQPVNSTMKEQIAECKKIEADFKKVIKGCGKQTGYFEGSPYHCGDMVQTTPCDGFESYCRKCMPKVKKAMSKFDSVVIPARKRLEELTGKVWV